MTENTITWDQDAEGVVTLTMDDPTAKVNTMNGHWQESMRAAVERLEQERESITGVILTSAKKTFFAGGDLDQLGPSGPEDAEDVFAMTEHVKSLLRRLEKLGRPVVAAINGAALGGGLEIALACHRRVAVDDPRIKVGLPEVTLGLLPGGGGITRLVRMLGLEKALMDWLLQGTQYRPAQAKEKGVIDELVSSPEELLPAARRWILEQGAAAAKAREGGPEETDEALGAPSYAVKPWDRKGFRLPGGTPQQPQLASRLPAFAATLVKTLHGADLPAPRAILSAAVEGAQVDFDTASRIETRYFTSLVTGRVSTAMVQAFHTEMGAIRAGAGLGERVSERHTIATAAVLGAGMMGAGIAHALATSGIDVVLKDVSKENAERGKAHCADLVGKAVARGRMDQSAADEVLGRIRTTDDYADIAGVDAVIEAVFEDFDLKSEVFAEVEKVVGRQTLLCSNTSTLPITQLQGPRERAADFVGLHFFSPVDRMKLVEIIRGEQTSQETVERAYDLVQQIRKVPILVNDGRGFYTSRVFGTLVLEAAAMVEEGVDPQRVERTARQAGFPGAPLAMLDEVSLTLTQHVRREAEKAAEAAGTERAEQPGERVVDRMVEEFDRPGRARGAGFYEYPAEGPKHLWPGLREHFAAEVDVSDEDLKDRFLYRMALETAACFEAGVLTDTASADIGGILGIGYPPHTGGPATFATNRPGGLADFVSRADALADAYGERFRPSDWLRERAAAGQGLA
ncbi:enoyl-CoA hydratase/isomerase family protein [Micrococcus porci]|uniref:3-hydroxyacyl-CoA dehydrogenase NAD-binding domain-containing protein n=1 Tax=Micrococcus porci TaxID=2856555 RepID=UPI001CCDAA68|nr:3-hydroxyacyl-CoA dehydrogenase NAD-binding domain-containing protein [Micrococcus porci]UBH25301.1 enoyl-CoA hydratase/isomerase family protein [Micrococcus porci]